MLDLVVDAGAAALIEPAWRRRLRVEVARMVRAAGKAEGEGRAGGAGAVELEVSLRLTGDPEIHGLNRDYRKHDRPTDVLAFAQREHAGAGRAQPGVLGDIVISVETAQRQAKRRGAAGLFTELRFLAAHGLCHLLGYDHRTDAEEAEMNARMAALIAEAGRRGRIRAA